MKYIIALVIFSALCYAIPSNSLANSKVTQKTMFECSILSGMKSYDGSSVWWGKWREVGDGRGQHDYFASNIKNNDGTYQQPVFECTVKNGSTGIRSHWFIDKTTGQYINTTINNQQKIFVGTTDKIRDGYEITIMICMAQGCS